MKRKRTGKNQVQVIKEYETAYNEFKHKALLNKRR